MQHKNFARALRRHHRARLKKARQFYWGNGFAGGRQWTPRSLGMVVHTPQMCSCLGCGNLRRWMGERTMQERRVYQESVWEALDGDVDHGDTCQAADTE
jgi:hypothetical protein